MSMRHSYTQKMKGNAFSYVIEYIYMRKCIYFGLKEEACSSFCFGKLWVLLLCLLNRNLSIFSYIFYKDSLFLVKNSKLYIFYLMFYNFLLLVLKNYT